MRPLGLFLGTAYPFWLRSRRVLQAIVPAALLVSALSHAFPGAAWLPWVQTTIAGLYLFGMAHLAGVFTYAGADLGAVESGFPRHMLTLPIRTAALAGLPMLMAVGVMGGLWALAAWSLINPLALLARGSPIDLLWPSTLVAATIAWLQAISWMPFWFPFVRAILGTGFLLGLGAVGFVGTSRGLSPGILAGFYVGTILMAFPAAVAGLARARRGDGTQIPWKSGSGSAWVPRVGVLADLCRRSLKNKAQVSEYRDPWHPILHVPHHRKSRGLSDGRILDMAITRRPFASPLAAQVWLEVRRNTLMIPCIAAGIPLIMAAITIMSGTNPTPIPYGPFLIQPIYLVLGISLASPLLAAAMHGAMLGKSDAWSKQITMSPFIAVRPLSTAHVIEAKLRAAAVGTIASWALVIAILGMWSLVPGIVEPGRTAAGLIAARISPRGVAIGIITLIFLVYYTWRMIAQSLFIFLCGLKWVATIVPIAGILLFVGGAALVSHMVRYPPAEHTVRAVIPWIVVSLLALKLGGAMWVFILSRRMGLVSSRQAAGLGAVWAGIAATFFIFLLWVIPAGPWPWVLLVLASSAMFPPGLRTFLALPALHANRHR